MKLVLERFAYSPMGTFGKLRVAGKEWFTVERPWKDNRRNVSCIPEGWYRIERATFIRGGYKTFLLQDVPGRSEILIHRANTMDDLAGCIAPGMRLGWVNGKWAVVETRKAFREFMEAMGTVASADLEVIHECRTPWMKGRA